MENICCGFLIRKSTKKSGEKLIRDNKYIRIIGITGSSNILYHSYDPYAPCHKHSCVAALIYHGLEIRYL